MYFLSLGEIAPLHIPLKYFNGDKITVATCSLSSCTTHYIHPCHPFLIISQGVAKLKHPCSYRLVFFSWVREQKYIKLSLHSIPSLSFPMFPCLVTFCLSIYPSLPSLLQSSFTDSIKHNKKTCLSSQKMVHALKLRLVLLGDEIFTQHFCTYLIVRQQRLKMVCGVKTQGFSLAGVSDVS